MPLELNSNSQLENCHTRDNFNNESRDRRVMSIPSQLRVIINLMWLRHPLCSQLNNIYLLKAVFYFPKVDINFPVLQIIMANELLQES